MTTLDRIKNLCKERGMNITALENECNFSKNSIVKWAKTSPSADRIISVAHYFNISADYLLCLTEEPTPLKQSDIAERVTTALSPELAELAQDEQFVDIAKLYKQMSRHYRERIFVYVLGVANGLRFNVQKILGK